MAIQAHLYPNNIGFPQDWITVTDNGCATAAFPHSSFNPQHKQPQQYSNIESQMHPHVFLDTNLLVPSSKSNNDFPSVPNSQSLALQFENQSREIDHYIKLQSEKLRMKLQEQRKQQVTELNKMELDLFCLMRQKDEEIGRAAKKTTELEDLLNKLEAENQAWRRAALESEAMILSLNNSLEGVKEKAHWRFNNNVLAADAQSCWDQGGGNHKEMEEEEEEEATRENVKEDEQQMKACKSCDYGMASFLFLPCRHLCSCKACEPFLQACPVCRMPKKASIEALIF